MLKFIVILLVVVSMLGCAEKESRVAQVESVVSAPAVETPYNKSCENDQHMTNAEIIAETKLCASAGLNASAFHCGDNQATTRIQCEPIVLK